MKYVVCTAVLTLSLISECSRAQQDRPFSPGIRDAHQVDLQAERNIPAPLVARAKVNPAAVQQDANELADIAQSLPALVNQTTRGILSTDLNKKLKRIEKLSKRLRGELAR
jgi:hypothetical protein